MLTYTYESTSAGSWPEGPAQQLPLGGRGLSLVRQPC